MFVMLAMFGHCGELGADAHDAGRVWPYGENQGAAGWVWPDGANQGQLMLMMPGGSGHMQGTRGS